MRHVVMFSGGIGSWAAAKRVAGQHGTRNMVLLFTDTRMEDEDLYRFLVQAAGNVGAPLVVIADGRTPWQVYRDERYLGNSRVDPCSKILKRKLADAWQAANCDPGDTTIYVGIDWTEEHRFIGTPTKQGLRERKAAAGWHYEAPMCAPPWLDKTMMLDLLTAEGIKPPRLYELGFAHNNCGGFCCKAGTGHFATLLRTMPDRYRHHEDEEQATMRHIGRSDIAILRDRSDGSSRPLTLRALRERIEAGAQPDMLETGGCGCFLDDEPDDPAEEAR